MKGLIFGILIISIIIVTGYFGIKYISSTQTNQTPSKSEPVTISGVLQKVKGDDYEFIILNKGKTVGIASYTIDLGQYTNKNVDITGQYSGTTLYADKVTASP